MQLVEALRQRTDSLQALLLGPGYGESVMVRAPGQPWLVVDSFSKTGSPNFSPAAVLEMTDTPWCGVVLTHPHKDHASRLRDVLDCRGDGLVGYAAAATPQPVDWDEFQEDGQETLEQSSVEDALAAIADRWHRNPSSKWPIVAGDKRELGGLTVHTLHPPSNFSAKDPNRLATPLLVAWHQVQLILGSDLTIPGWREVLSTRKNQPLSGDFLKIPDHGSENAFLPCAIHVPLGPWALTPFRRGRGVPSFGASGDMANVLGVRSPIHLTALPFEPTSVSRREGARAEVERLQSTNKIADDIAFTLAGPTPKPEDHWVLVTFQKDGRSQVDLGAGAWSVTP